MFIWNTLSGKKEELAKPEGRPLNLFVCGPTVYDYSHIGHARTYVAFDTFVRYLRHKGWDVFYLQNITNVEDRIIVRAKENNENPLSLADRFAKAHLEDMASLNIDSANVYAPATKFISDIEKQVKILREKGYAYEISGDGIYFDIAKFPDYGKLSGRTVAQAEDGVSRIDESIKKLNRGDFCLWKFPKHPAKPNFFQNIRGSFVNTDGEPLWKTSLGWGRPGWHIEDTAISEHYFGPQYDVHGGGVDLKFPHHEAEIAQQESASGKIPFVKIWMHAGFLTIGGQKMSKSLGNFTTIRDALEKYSPEILRWFFLSSHYRSPVDYLPENLKQIEAIYRRMRVFLEKLSHLANASAGEKKGGSRVAEAIQKSSNQFESAMEDDFNTPLALAALLGLMGQFQEDVWKMKREEARMLENHLEKALGVLGIAVKSEPIPQNVKKLAAERELCRVNKQFVQSDALREEIRVLGYSIEDTPQGSFVYKE